MTAGRGIVHSEMPEQEEGLMRGFQLWVNLPARDKMTAPRYQDIPPEHMPELQPRRACALRLLAGRIGDVAGPVSGIERTQPLYVDVQLAAGAQLRRRLPAAHNAFAYVYEGAARIGGAAAARAGELRSSAPAIASRPTAATAPRAWSWSPAGRSASRWRATARS